MRTKLLLASLLAVALVATACKGTMFMRQSDDPNQTLTRAEAQRMIAEMERKNLRMARDFNESAVGFYKETADAYFLIGYEFYQLAEQFKKAGNEEKQKRYEALAIIYSKHEDDLKRLARERQELLDELDDDEMDDGYVSIPEENPEPYDPWGESSEMSMDEMAPAATAPVATESWEGAEMDLIDIPEPVQPPFINQP